MLVGVPQMIVGPFFSNTHNNRYSLLLAKDIARTISEHVMNMISRIAPPVVAQDAQEDEEADGNGLVYTAYFKVDYSDLDEWIDIYHEHSVPLLQELEEEGLITGWAAYQHSTGSEYNWRFAVIAGKWGQFDQFWEEYLERLQERSPEASARWFEMIQAHNDEVWNITGLHLPDPLPEVGYLYDSLFQINYGQLEEWNRVWNESAGPILDQAMEDGILAGWVVEGHNTGGRYNWKVLYFFEEWDHMDDVFAKVFGQITGDDQVWPQLSPMVQAHDDVIWSSVPDPSN